MKILIWHSFHHLLQKSSRKVKESISTELTSQEDLMIYGKNYARITQLINQFQPMKEARLYSYSKKNKYFPGFIDQL